MTPLPKDSEVHNHTRDPVGVLVIRVWTEPSGTRFRMTAIKDITRTLPSIITTVDSSEMLDLIAKFFSDFNEPSGNGSVKGLP